MAVKRNERITEENRHEYHKQEREKWLREIHGGIDNVSPELKRLLGMS